MIDEIGTESELRDDMLRLIFTCCHPALSREAQVALALRTLARLEVDAIARAFLVPEATMAKRLVRARSKIATARIPYVIPSDAEFPDRLAAVLAVVYLIATEPTPRPARTRWPEWIWRPRPSAWPACWWS